MAEQHLQIKLPADKAGGVFADFVRAWHTKDAFVLDFISMDEPPHAEDDERIVVNGSVVSRVRIPPSQIFELMKALNQQMSAWEKENGKTLA